MSQDEHDAVAWRAQWRKTIDETAGVATYLVEGDEYVEDVRRADAERLSQLDA
jgi:hypothetical protein